MAYQQQQPVIPSPSSGPGPGGFQYMNSPFGDTTFTKVFVGGLAWETRSETMGRYFEQFGEVLEAVVITDKNTGRSKGYGFVTFRDPESARRACADPTPVIDGRRANCNLASLGRPRPAVPFGRLRSPSAYLGSLPAARGGYAGSFGYQQPVTYGFQQGLMYSPYGYAAYGPEYAYHQGIHSPFGSQQYLHLYGVPGAVNTTMYPYNQLNQDVPGSHSFTALQGSAIPGHQIVQFGVPSVNAITTTSVPTIPVPYPTVCSIWLEVEAPKLKILQMVLLVFLGILLEYCKADLGIMCWFYQVLQHLFRSSRSSFYPHIHLNSCRVAVLTKILGEGLI